MSVIHEEYIKAMYRLAKAAPPAWLEFVQRFDAYTIQELEKGIGTSNADMAVSLGMGRRMVDLRNEFRDIEKLADKIKVSP
jgi:hypothetical protein